MRAKLRMITAVATLCLGTTTMTPLAHAGGLFGDEGVKVSTPKISIHDVEREAKNAREDAQRKAKNAREDAQRKAKEVREATQRKAEHWTSDRVYFAYRDFFLARAKESTTVIQLTPDGTHYKRLVQSGVLPKNVDIHTVKWYFHVTVPPTMGAITFGNRVLVGAKYDPNDPNLTRTMAHELTHVGQYQRMGGEKQFARRYIGQITAAVRKGKFLDMHDDVGLEKEAIAVEKAWLKWWNNTGYTADISGKSWH